MRECVRDVFAIYDNNISPGLLMIIIKLIILYFIQIRHTDDFPPTGTPASALLLGLTASVLLSIRGIQLHYPVVPQYGVLLHYQPERISPNSIERFESIK